MILKFHQFISESENKKSKSKKSKKKEVWDTPDPSKKDKKLTPDQKSAAKARAKKAGRPYPNLVDNMAVSKKGKK